MAQNAIAVAAERDFLRIPIWFGEVSKDLTLAKNWIERVKRLQATCQWNDTTAIGHLFSAIHGKAVQFQMHHVRSYPRIKTPWTVLIRMFTQAVGVKGKDTSRIANLNLTQMQNQVLGKVFVEISGSL